MAKCCVVVPFTATAACGSVSFYRNAAVRDDVTCKVCKKTEHYKNLPALARKFRK